jgi:hypothetical protein
MLLRKWWKIGRKEGVMHPDGWLLPVSIISSPSAQGRFTASQPKRRMRQALPNGSGRTPCATASPAICLQTTTLYTRVATRIVKAMVSLLDRLAMFSGTQVAPDG